MGIEIPAPKGGPAVFTTSPLGNDSPAGLSPDEERLRTPELGDDLNDSGSVCLSEGEACWRRLHSFLYRKLCVSALIQCSGF